MDKKTPDNPGKNPAFDPFEKRAAAADIARRIAAFRRMNALPHAEPAPDGDLPARYPPNQPGNRNAQQAAPTDAPTPDPVKPADLPMQAGPRKAKPDDVHPFVQAQAIGQATRRRLFDKVVDKAAGAGDLRKPPAAEPAPRRQVSAQAPRLKADDRANPAAYAADFSALLTRPERDASTRREPTLGNPARWHAVADAAPALRPAIEVAPEPVAGLTTAEVAAPSAPFVEAPPMSPPVAEVTTAPDRGVDEAPEPAPLAEDATEAEPIADAAPAPVSVAADAPIERDLAADEAPEPAPIDEAALEQDLIAATEAWPRLAAALPPEESPEPEPIDDETPELEPIAEAAPVSHPVAEPSPMLAVADAALERDDPVDEAPVPGPVTEEAPEETLPPDPIVDAAPAPGAVAAPAPSLAADDATPAWDEAAEETPAPDTRDEETPEPDRLVAAAPVADQFTLRPERYPTFHVARAPEPDDDLAHAVDPFDDRPRDPLLVAGMPAVPYAVAHEARARRRRPYRAALLVGLVAIIGGAAGATMLWQFGLGDTARQIVTTTAAQIAPGDQAESPAPAPQAAAVEPAAPATPARPAIAAPAVEPAPAAAPAPEVAALPPSVPESEAPAPEPAPGIAATLPEMPAAGSAATEPPDAAPLPAGETTAAAEPPLDFPQTPRPLGKMLTPPLSQMPGAGEIGQAPVSMPRMPGAGPAGASTASTLAAPNGAPPEAFSGAAGTPRVVATLKPDPAKAFVVTEPVAKPFVPQTAAKPATKPKPAAQPAKQAKVIKPAPGPLDQVLDALAPFMNGSKPQPTEAGSRK